MKSRTSNFLHLLKVTLTEWDRREASRMGASLAFYSLLSMAPLVVLVVGICALLTSVAQAQEHFLGQFRLMMGDDAANALETVLKGAQQPTAGILANAVGLATLLLGASAVLLELRMALNRLWGVEPSAISRRLRGKIRDRLLSFGMVLVVGILLLISLSISAGLSAVGKYVGTFPWLPPTVWELINFVVSVAVITGMFSLIFRFVPDVRLPWDCILRGAVVTAILFTAGKTAIGIYLGKAGVGSAYGAAGSLVVLIVWIYYSAQIFYFGAIMTHIHAVEKLAEGTETIPQRNCFL